MAGTPETSTFYFKETTDLLFKISPDGHSGGKTQSTYPPKTEISISQSGLAIFLVFQGSAWKLWNLPEENPTFFKQEPKTYFLKITERTRLSSSGLFLTNFTTRVMWKKFAQLWG